MSRGNKRNLIYLLIFFGMPAYLISSLYIFHSSLQSSNLAACVDFAVQGAFNPGVCNSIYASSSAVYSSVLNLLLMPLWIILAAALFFILRRTANLEEELKEIKEKINV